MKVKWAIEVYHFGRGATKWLRINQRFDSKQEAEKFAEWNYKGRAKLRIVPDLIK